MFNRQYLTNNEFINNLKRPFESEDKVFNNKIKLGRADFDSFTSKVDIILESQTVSNNTDGMELSESDVYNSIDETENLSPYGNNKGYETIDLISDSQESGLSEASDFQSESLESNTDSSIIDDDLLHKLPDELLVNNLRDLKNECYKIYPRLLEYVKNEDLILHVRTFFTNVNEILQDIV